MYYLEESISDIRALLYDDFRTIIKHCCSGNRLVVSPSLSPFVWADEEHESCIFRCDTIEKNDDGNLIFSQGSFSLDAAQIDTDNLVYMHDELLDMYDIDDSDDSGDLDD